MLLRCSAILSTVLRLALLQMSLAAMDGEQRVFDASADRDSDWRVSVSDEWDVLGPFPIQAREQHFLSPSFPLNLSEPIDWDEKWPSSYADGGNVEWTTASMKTDGTLDVSFPDIRWTSLRATEGWAALQHHTVLHTSITVHPPSVQYTLSDGKPPRLLVQLLQGSFFTVIPSGDETDQLKRYVPKWYAGNIYAMNRAPAQAVFLPVPPSTTTPTKYDLYVSGDYEIRLFGDPLYNADRTGVPVLSVTLSIEIEAEPPTDVVSRVPSHDVSCDFIDGWAFGDALGVGIRSSSGWWTARSVSPAGGKSDIGLILLNETRIAPTQTRVVPIRLNQTASFTKSEIIFDLFLVSDTASTTIRVTLPIRQHKQWTTSDFPPDGIKASYFYATSMPTAFVVIPPEEENLGEPRPAVLALHGAGVDILAMPFWIQALPRQQRSWVIAPTGRTAWGLDWHGPSARDAWSTLDALHAILQDREPWKAYAIAEHTRVLVMGHSNGGQGTWYLASRYPDRVVAAIPAAAYIKSQSYVPLTQSRSAHFIDPSMRAILESSLTPDDNDLFLSNLVDIPILAIHGGDDDNVPVWHTREAVSILKTLNARANVTYREDPGQLHWYPSVFDNDQVREFMRSTLKSEPGSLSMVSRATSGSFTLTVSNPSESGSLHGWRIHSLLTPGRLAKLIVKVEDARLSVRTVNVRSFGVHHSALGSASDFTVDGVPIAVNGDYPGALLYSCELGPWKPVLGFEDSAIVPSGRMFNVLLTAAPFVVVVRDTTSSHILSAALRIVHSLNVYHKLDAEIIDDGEAVHRFSTGVLELANIIILGDPSSTYFQSILHHPKTAFVLKKQDLHLKGRLLGKTSTATMFLHPHPGADSALMLLMYVCEDEALEKALQLFPIRTGVPMPDWISIGERADTLGAAGVEGVGVWNSKWDWNEAMSWF